MWKPFVRYNKKKLRKFQAVTSLTNFPGNFLLEFSQKVFFPRKVFPEELSKKILRFFRENSVEKKAVQIQFFAFFVDQVAACPKKNEKTGVRSLPRRDRPRDALKYSSSSSSSSSVRANACILRRAAPGGPSAVPSGSVSHHTACG